jgi:hypothetical protein
MVANTFVSPYFIECDNCGRITTIREIWYKNTGERYCATCMKLVYPEWYKELKMWEIEGAEQKRDKEPKKEEKRNIINELFGPKKEEK